jgi:uncharacterized protein
MPPIEVTTKKDSECGAVPAEAESKHTDQIPGSPKSEPPQPSGGRVLVVGATGTALLTMCVGAILALLGQMDIRAMIKIPHSFAEHKLIFGAAGLGVGVLLVLVFLFADWFLSFRVFVAAMGKLMHRYSLAAIVYSSAVTAVSEEFLYRLILQPTMGLFFSSVLYAVAHFDRGGPFTVWSLWTFLYSMLLGWIYQGTGSIVTSLTAHFVFNVGLTLILRFRYQWTLKRSLLESTDASSGQIVQGD